jgi:hypothetical protein
MSYVQRVSIPLTTDAAGAATAYSETVTGRILQVRYVKTDFANGVDFVVTSEATGEIIWDEDNVNADATRAPRQATHDTVGVASVYAAGGAAVNDYIAVANDRIKVVVAAGGDTKTGVVYVLLG